MATFHIEHLSWQNGQRDLSSIRQTVFIEEQRVPVALEWDEHDADALHLLARDGHGQPIGCARILADGSIGRMAVLPAWRRHGVGRALLATAIDYGRERGWPEVRLSAQTHAIGLYQHAGFTVCSDTYLDAGIPHRDMTLRLST